MLTRQNFNIKIEPGNSCLYSLVFLFRWRLSEQAVKFFYRYVQPIHILCILVFQTIKYALIQIMYKMSLVKDFYLSHQFS